MASAIVGTCWNTWFFQWGQDIEGVMKMIAKNVLFDILKFPGAF